ncbi:hypothetical protein K6V98_02660 [Collinsella sp. AGMB00827]|uniref:Electron transport complex subunit RsxA n=1 Tax=Collinsella ureilytica TaxID=2869515 RepID=A0ABS7MIZ9_9ACTN|nr:Rnf-Nqr domain containing protein [Collinsella urealyticum]MBY4797267.1 hypothetical protein [Collinsella urealyticum]
MSVVTSMISQALDNNLVFAQVVAMVSVYIISMCPQDTLRFGVLLGLATVVTGLVGSALYVGILVPQEMGFFAPVVLVLINAVLAIAGAFVVELRGKTKEPEQVRREAAFIAVNAALLAAPLMNAASCDAGVATPESLIGASLGAGLGVFLAVVLFESIMNRVDAALVPKAMRGLPLALVTASFLALAFSGVIGIASGMLS